MEKYIQELLCSIPQGVTYTTIPEELDLEDVPQERIDGVCKLLTHEEEYIQLSAAILPCSWGIDEGFQALVQRYETGAAEGCYTHRLYGYDETAEHILWALIFYQGNKADISEQAGEKARQQIQPYVKELLQKVAHPEDWEKIRVKEILA